MEIQRLCYVMDGCMLYVGVYVCMDKVVCAVSYVGVFVLCIHMVMYIGITFLCGYVCMHVFLYVCMHVVMFVYWNAFI